MKELPLDLSGVTLKEAAGAVYDAILAGKFKKEDLQEWIDKILSDCYEPKPVRIFAKAIGFFLRHKDGEGIVVKVDDEQWTVSVKGEQIVINGPCKYDCMDGSTVTLHDTKEDAVTAAALNQEGYMENSNTDTDMEIDIDKI